MNESCPNLEHDGQDELIDHLTDARTPPLISVIVITYNRAKTLAAALDSAIDQTFSDYEIVVVDDGSTDHTPELLAGYTGRIRVLRQENQGIAAARNTGCAAARGAYCAFLDSDDKWFPWALQTLADLLKQLEFSPAMIGLAYRTYRNEAELADIRHHPLGFERAADWLEGANVLGFSMGTAHTVVRRDVILGAGGFAADVPAGSDTDLFLRAGTAPGFIRIRQPITLAYRKHEDNVTGNPDKVYLGSLKKIEHERQGQYAGGKSRQRERRQQISNRLRSASVMLLRCGRFKQACNLYRRMLWWHLQLGRWRYLAAFPVMALMPPLRRANTIRR